MRAVLWQKQAFRPPPRHSAHPSIWKENHTQERGAFFLLLKCPAQTIILRKALPFKAFQLFLLWELKPFFPLRTGLGEEGKGQVAKTIPAFQKAGPPRVPLLTRCADS
jgi:hypothetical protein